ncbi:hypothetical protein ONZ45_g1849 [Pleurotus djamor]|nr:hypothetical protein ONZ45_g1849 [Pleurotus djamor]
MNPSQYFHAGYSSHYARAYMQSMQATQQGPVYASSSQITLPGPASGPSYHQPQRNPAWYQPGQCRCTYNGCTFSGSPKALELHKMDRHLIYPPGWNKRRNPSDWDADPSLKGKPIAIQGTGIFLDTQEQIDSWIEERKRRWPSKGRVDEKARKMNEAIARGQLTPQELGLSSNKRRRLDVGDSQDRRNNNNRGGARGRGRGHARGAHRSGSNRVPLPPKPVFQHDSAKASPVVPNLPQQEDEDSDDDSAPEAVSSKIPTSTEPPPAPPIPTPTEAPAPQISQAPQHVKREHVPQPRRQPHNPFANHKNLLRNLIIPEIRMTVSNLSQAIRFLVNNDFLDNVELKPGDATSSKIQVLPPNDNDTEHTVTNVIKQ